MDVGRAGQTVSYCAPALLPRLPTKLSTSHPSAPGYWTINTPGTPIPISAPYTLQLTAQTGETLSLNIPSIIPLDLGVNFS